MRAQILHAIDRPNRFRFLVWQVPTCVFAVVVGGIGAAATGAARVPVAAAIVGVAAILAASASDLFLSWRGRGSPQRLAVIGVHLVAAGVICMPLAQTVPSSFLLMLHPSMWLAYRLGLGGAAVALAWDGFVLVAPRVLGGVDYGASPQMAAPAVVAAGIVGTTVFLSGIVGRRVRQLKTLLAAEAKQRAAADRHASHQRVTLEAAFNALNAAVVVVDANGDVQMNARARAMNGRARLDQGRDAPGAEVEVYDLDSQRVPAEDSGLRRVIRGEVFNSLIHRVGPPGDQVVLSMTALPLVGDDGVKFGQVLTAWDMTDLAEATEERQNFISTVSHELKTPLTAATAGVEAMSSMRDNPDDLLRLVDLVDRQIKTLSGRVQQLLRASAARSAQSDLIGHAQGAGGGGGGLLEPDDVETRMASHRAAADHRGLAFSVTVSGSGEVLGSHPVDAVLEICDQVVGNAVKFVDEGGRVDLEVTTAADGVTVRCSDDGPGLTPDEVRQATNMFFRGDRAVAGAVEGLGLGLAIVDRLVEATGGRLVVDSTPGAGTVVTAVLPASSIAPD